MPCCRSMRHFRGPRKLVPGIMTNGTSVFLPLRWRPSIFLFVLLPVGPGLRWKVKRGIMGWESPTCAQWFIWKWVCDGNRKLSFVENWLKTNIFSCPVFVIVEAKKKQKKIIISETVSLSFTRGHLCTYAHDDGIVQATSVPWRNGCSLIYAESDTISCYHPPLRIQPCTNVGQRPNYRNTFTMPSYLTVHCRISAITGPLVNDDGNYLK